MHTILETIFHTAYKQQKSQHLSALALAVQTAHSRAGQRLEVVEHSDPSRVWNFVVG